MFYTPDVTPDTQKASPDYEDAPAFFSAPNTPPGGQPASLSAKASWLPTITAGVGFLTDAYDLFVIDIVLLVLASIDASQSAADRGLVASAMIVGTLIGQTTFGLLADILGRHNLFRTTPILLAGGALLSACVTWAGPVSLYTKLAACRLLLGVGVGGEYPLAATVTSETSDTAHRGRALAAVFAMQGVGMALSPLLVLVLLSLPPPLSLPPDLIWRIALAVGALPAIAIIYYRWTLPETALFNKAHEDTKTSPFRHQRRLFVRYRGALLSTCLNWFLLDVTFYGMGSFKTAVGASLGFSLGVTGGIMSEAWFALMVAGLAMPGYVLAVVYAERIGYRRLQLFGFGMMGLCFVLLGIEQYAGGQRPAIELVLFGLTFLFSNFGPNTTTFLLPTQIYPTLIRASCHGISAASGKLGAVLGSAMFAPLQQSIGLPSLLLCCAAVALLGHLATLTLTPLSANHPEQLFDHLDDETTALNNHNNRGGGKDHQHRHQQRTAGGADRSGGDGGKRGERDGQQQQQDGSGSSAAGGSTAGASTGETSSEATGAQAGIHSARASALLPSRPMWSGLIPQGFLSAQVTQQSAYGYTPYGYPQQKPKQQEPAGSSWSARGGSSTNTTLPSQPGLGLSGPQVSDHAFPVVKFLQLSSLAFRGAITYEEEHQMHSSDPLVKYQIVHSWRHNLGPEDGRRAVVGWKVLCTYRNKHQMVSFFSDRDLKEKDLQRVLRDIESIAIDIMRGSLIVQSAATESEDKYRAATQHIVAQIDQGRLPYTAQYLSTFISGGLQGALDQLSGPNIYGPTAAFASSLHSHAVAASLLRPCASGSSTAHPQDSRSLASSSSGSAAMAIL
ncbi:unnamed protein product [Vitrella brassicaformis CCMP3155]|uniref:Major facilitator superfamily (MFS) profile domain-containing protein n=2 Tax=Vitrella brassicaformis TaxID=1169539 RepID=A0A0G4GP18_VITBC|nr:unnamed protein product [Vitrella brassicaformis CCMP3155]|eukprot:CEM32056.1 unnamed protein product [Vitrella brassicaformis CCMP3155]